MNNDDYLLPAIAAIVVAILFPIYWSYLIGTSSFSLTGDYYDSVDGVNLGDWVYLLIGILSIYVYFNFKRVLNERLNFNKIDILLLIMIVSMAIFSIGLFLIDAFMSVSANTATIGTHKIVLNIVYAISFGCMIILGIVDILIGILLLKNSQGLPGILKALAVISIIQGFFGITIVFGFALIAIYPVYLIVLAIFLLRKPDMLEVV